MVGIWLLLLNCLPSQSTFAQCDFINDITGITQSQPPTGAAADPALYTQVFVLVNNLGNIYATGATPDFTGVPAGTYYLYAVNYDNAEAAAVTPLLANGQPWVNLVAYGDDPAFCLNYSSAYTGCAISVCDEMDVCASQILNETATGFAAAGYTQTYCIICDSIVQAVSAAGLFDLSTIAAVTAGANCQLLAINYETAGGIPVAVGDDWATIDANDCNTANCFAFMGMNLLISDPAIAAVTTNVDCNSAANGAVDITVSNGTAAYTFTWSNGPVTEDISGLSGGIYSVTVQDAVGCTTTNTVTITEPTPVTITIDNVVNASCTGIADGSIAATGSGGTPSYTFGWSNGASTEDLTGVTANVYTVTITDANGCTATNGTTVGQNVLLDVSISASSDVSCGGAADGSATAVGTGGTPSYTFDWGAAGSGASLSNLSGGTYMVTLSDVNGCSDTASVTILEPLAISLAIDTINPITSCGSGNDGSMQALASGGTGTLSYDWSNGPATALISNLGPGAYVVTVTDANGCTAIAGGTITGTFSPSVNPYVINPGVSDTLLAWGVPIDINGGNDQSAQGVSYVWTIVGTPAGPVNFVDSFAHATSIQPTLDGTYTLQITATSADGCTAIGTITIEIVDETFWGMPTAFTPNGDGLNELVYPIGLNPDFILNFRMFNRFGEKVYDSNGSELPNGGWDGVHRGQPQPRDSYMYILEYQFPSDTTPQVLRGDVMLIR